MPTVFHGFTQAMNNFSFMNMGIDLIWLVLIGILSIVLFKTEKDRMLAGVIMSAAFVSMGLITTIYSILIVGGLAIFTIIWHLKN